MLMLVLVLVALADASGHPSCSIQCLRFSAPSPIRFTGVIDRDVLSSKNNGQRWELVGDELPTATFGDAHWTARSRGALPQQLKVIK